MLDDPSIIVRDTRPWDYAWSPWSGCTPVSAGCDNCYVKAYDRINGWGVWGEDAPRLGAVSQEMMQKYYRLSVLYNKKAATFRACAECGFRKNGFVIPCPRCSSIKIPLRVRPLVYVGHQCDMAEDRKDVAPWRRFVMRVIRGHTAMDWMIVTKRPENAGLFVEGADEWPENLHFGVSVENQAAVEERLPLLTSTGVVNKIVVAEPLLAPIDLTPWLDEVSWVLVAGETAAKDSVRHADDAWSVTIRDDCFLHDVPFYFMNPSTHYNTLGRAQWDQHVWDKTNHSLRVREVPDRLKGEPIYHE